MEAVGDPAYWNGRMADAERKGVLHHSIYLCNHHTWSAIEDKHREILAKHIRSTDSILDVGCGYGRLLSLLPEGWRGDYFGLDLCPEFIGKAIEIYRERVNDSYYRRYMHGRPILDFCCVDVAEGSLMLQRKLVAHQLPLHDWAVMISFRPMVIRNQGQAHWDRIEANVRKLARNLLYLEYNTTDEGEVVRVQ